MNLDQLNFIRDALYERLSRNPEMFKKFTDPLVRAVQSAMSESGVETILTFDALDAHAAAVDMIGYTLRDKIDKERSMRETERRDEACFELKNGSVIRLRMK